MNKRNSDWYIPPDWRCLLCLNLAVPCIAVFAALLLPIITRLKTADIGALYDLGLGAGVFGIILLFVARLPLYKQHRFWTFGPMQLDRKHRWIYWLSYVLVATSLLLLGIVWLRAN